MDESPASHLWGVDMDKLSCVELIEDSKDLTAKGIYKGCMGVLLHNVVKNDIWLTMFMNSNNYGEFAAAVVDSKKLRPRGTLPADIKAQVEDIVKSKSFLENKSFSPVKVKEHQIIELTAEKAVYIKHGVHKGMRGIVMSAYAINGKWEVIFTNPEGQDLADIEVSEKDFIVP